MVVRAVAPAASSGAAQVRIAFVDEPVSKFAVQVRVAAVDCCALTLSARRGGRFIRTDAAPVGDRRQSGAAVVRRASASASAQWRAGQFHVSNMKALHKFFVARLELQVRRVVVASSSRSRRRVRV